MGKKNKGVEEEVIEEVIEAPEVEVAPKVAPKEVKSLIGKEIGGKEVVASTPILDSEGKVVGYKVTDSDSVVFTLSLEETKEYVK